MPRTYTRRPVIERVLDKLDQSGGLDACWPWQGGKNKAGYGYVGVSVEQGTALVHRVVFEAFHGPIPAGMYVCHRCDHPWCGNPKHLFAAAPVENTADMIRKGRSIVPPRVLSVEQVRVIRQRYTEGGVTQYRLADEFGISQTMVSHIVLRQAWVNV